MGQLKLYKMGQTIFEDLMFGTSSYSVYDSSSGNTSHADHTMRYDDLGDYFYSDSELTVASSSKHYLVYPSTGAATVSGYVQLFRFSAYQDSVNSHNKLYATSNSTHDISRSTFTNVVGSVSVSTATVTNGRLDLTIIVTNTTDAEVAVESIERSVSGTAISSKGATARSQLFGLGWAYYLGDDAFTLAAGGSKTITISIQFADLTQ